MSENKKLPGVEITRLQGIGGLPMNLNRPDMTETVKSENYTNKSLQKDSNPTTMEVVTQTNAVKSPTDSPATTKLVYTVEEIARMLAISLRSAYNLVQQHHRIPCPAGRRKHPQSRNRRTQSKLPHLRVRIRPAGRSPWHPGAGWAKARYPSALLGILASLQLCGKS